MHLAELFIHNRQYLNREYWHIPVTGITSDSRHVETGNLFFAIKGFESDGHHFLDQAMAKGACALVVQEDVGEKKIPVIRVNDSRETLADAAAQYFDEPAKAFPLVGITGTNGKTTVAYLLESIFQAAGMKTGLLGTIAYRWPGHEENAIRTTPDIIEMNRLLARMRDQSVQIVIMEVSSHALYLHRVQGFQFKVAVFTNLSREHMDFHHTLEDYAETKSMLFEMIGPEGKALINRDDSMSDIMMQKAGQRAITFGMKNSKVDYRIGDIKFDHQKTCFKIYTKNRNYLFSTHLLGRFNVMNSAVAAIAGILLDLDSETIQRGIQNVHTVRGRMEGFMSQDHYRVIIDYAHTPDALENVLQACREFTSNQLIIVFGCGGDRDTGKRPEMGKIAESLADTVYVTSDNPRTEDPEKIIQDILSGMKKNEKIKIVINRKEAIRQALGEAKRGDTVLIAGKGHEDYQEVNHQKYPFDDRTIAEAFLMNHGNL